MKVNCAVCKKEFVTKPCYLLNGRGKHCSRRCSNITKKGYTPWNKGLKGMGICKPNSGSFSSDNTKGNLNIEWKGDSVGYYALHDWVYRWKGVPDKCSHCGSLLKVQWANKSHSYKRTIDDWIALCHWCHRKYDGISKFTKEDILTIIKENKLGVSGIELSKRYGVNVNTIYKITQRKTWKYI